MLGVKSLSRLGFRQTEGFARSVVPMLEMADNLSVPSYSQICRRQKEPKVAVRPKYRKLLERGGQPLHIAVDSTGLKVYGVGRPEWERRSGYHRRSKAGVAMFRYKTIFGPKMYARVFGNQKTGVRIKCAIINRFNQLGMPVSVKVA